MTGPDRDRGSTLLFFPAALLVVVVLASITVDFARARLVQQQAEDAAAAATNDAVTAGLDVSALRAGHGYRLDQARVARVVAASVGAHDASGSGRLRASAQVVEERSVEVVVRGETPLGFASALPGAPERLAVEARARATARLR